MEQVQGDDGTEAPGSEGEFPDVAVEEDDVARHRALQLGKPFFRQAQQGDGLVQKDHRALVIAGVGFGGKGQGAATGVQDPACRGGAEGLATEE